MDKSGLAKTSQQVKVKLVKVTCRSSIRHREEHLHRIFATFYYTSWNLRTTNTSLNINADVLINDSRYETDVLDGNFHPSNVRCRGLRVQTTVEH